MSDPSRDGFTCCDVPMLPMVPASLELMLGEVLEPLAFACLACFKWRHALPPGNVLRPQVVRAMNDWADHKYREAVRDGRI